MLIIMMRLQLLLAVLLILLGQLVSTSISSPNIVLLITDDQDVALGSLDTMLHTLRAFRQHGIEFRNAFVSTPICCPSRSTILSGLYAHNHDVMTNNGNCAGPEWRSRHENGTFAVHLARAGYRTGFFGKYLNDYDGSWTPPGWTEWMGLVRNSRYYNYTLNRNGKLVWHGDTYEQDYLTDLVTNQSLRFMEQSMAQQPFLAVLSFPAPHGPEDPAPQHAELFVDVETHRTDAWNYAPNPDKQWLLQRTGKMEPIHVVYTDQAHRRRLQTLQSVDEAVQRLLHHLRALNLLRNTFLLYTSDHGYHLGQFGLVKGKAMPYDFDARVPFLLRGPGLPKGKTVHSTVSNIDIAPTLLDMAGLRVPDNMDGRSVLDAPELGWRSTSSKPWRDTVLIERGKMPALRKFRDRLRAQRTRMDKQKRIARECAKAKEYRVPCHQQPQPEWQCVKDAGGRWRIHRCPAQRCRCGKGRGRRSGKDEDDEEEEEEETEEIEEEFLRELDQREVVESGEWYQGVFDVADDATLDHHNTTKTLALRKRRGAFGERKQLDHKIRRLRNRLAHFRYIRKRLRKSGNLTHCACSDGQKDAATLTHKHRRPLRHRNKILPSNNGTVTPVCHMAQMNCFLHSADHWRTPPLWPEEFGQFCFCQNANNNSYWCSRTVNATHNILYCEFVTEEVSFYNLAEDPDQLINAVAEQPEHMLEQLSAQLGRLKACKGRAQCDQAAMMLSSVESDRTPNSK